MTSTTVQVDRLALAELADYAADDLRHHLGPAYEDLEAAVREAYDALDHDTDGLGEAVENSPPRKMLCGECGWQAPSTAPVGGTCPVCGEGELQRWTR